ncbi:hypothetical protein [Lactobacillus xylocopicola]|uniref:Uncharacterized protein n=1 Tax=Lactobacillus xylocopicola TaxID=2976676 RepID=A0ABM8BFB7_9LACO|nr:hypothetical protein [Lactobacillus xylocopicola]BDR59932.1 hypothetical protein KIM322_01930 [Lactobacillus xylocopicola]
MVKVGLRKPSLKKTIAAKTKGRATRTIKKALIPNYGKRGMGWAHPWRKIYHAIYHKTTNDARKLFSASTSAKRSTTTAEIRYFKVKTAKDVQTNRILYYTKVVRSCLLWFGVLVSVLGQLKAGIYPLVTWLLRKLPTLPFGGPIAPSKLKEPQFQNKE